MSLQACYSFRGTSIDYATTSTYFVNPFVNNAQAALPALEQTLTEDLKEKIRAESRLVLSEEDPDIEFSGTLVSYRITAEAPTAGEVTAINRLTIILAIEYYDNVKDEQVWKRNFSFFYDFPSNVDFSSVEEEAISTISTQIMEDIFNAAFSSW